MSATLSFTVHKALSGESSSIEVPEGGTLGDLRTAVRNSLDLPRWPYRIVCDPDGPTETLDITGQTVQIDDLLRASEGCQPLCKLGLVSGMKLYITMVREPVQWVWANAQGQETGSCSNPGAVLVREGDRFPSSADELLAFLRGRDEDGDDDSEMQQWGAPVASNHSPPWLSPDLFFSNLIELYPGVMGDKLPALVVNLRQLLGPSEVASCYKFYSTQDSFERFMRIGMSLERRHIVFYWVALW
ncbi:unnamed protein product [Polarella glacialis]|uniref:Uncharacterized protein n=1 Tax=Polarella glacialis TaxID=89957 RepID=A0A813JHF5_POLGL|nr:unnamed protein product [Polarella glacialis]CAE8635583.1 unnamed protein product [Polarella glacialis]CAE8677042.1 unnamed protein product [Polarella glacialis]